MSEENVEIVVGQFNAVNARDFAAVMNAYADDVTLNIHADIGVVATTATGKQAVGEWFADWFGQFDQDYRFEINESWGTGDRVFIDATHHGTGRTSGVPVTQRTAYIYTVRDGKVSAVEVWGDRETALEAAGLSE